MRVLYCSAAAGIACTALLARPGNAQQIAEQGAAAVSVKTHIYNSPYSHARLRLHYHETRHNLLDFSLIA